MALQDTRDGRALLRSFERRDEELQRLREAMAAHPWAVRYVWRGGWCETAPMSFAEACAQAAEWMTAREGGDWNFGEITVIPDLGEPGRG